MSNDQEHRAGAIDIKDDEAVQLIGRELLTKLGLCFRISTMYNLDNNVLIKPVEGLCDVVNRMIEHYGGCNFNNVGENYYVSFTSSGTPNSEEKAAREKLLAQHVLLIPKSKLEDTLKPRTELLEKPSQKK